MISKLIILPVLLLFVTCSAAATVDTVSIYSNAMHKSYRCVIIKPTVSKAETESFPVVYLLHGYSGWYANWLLSVPALKDYADQYAMMIVCPDGGYNSWYIDSPVDSTIKFETYICNEVVDYIDAHFPTIKNRKGRAITGLSMGGHGGLFLGFRHTAEFGACGSMSGGVDLRPFTKNWELSQRLGDSLNHWDNWENYSVISLLDHKPVTTQSIIIDCGTEDFFYTVNQQLHEKMLRLKIPHEYIERPGQHNWAYWRNAVQYQLLFFHNYFGK